MGIPNHPSNLELQALSVLWYDGPSTVGTIHANLPDGKVRAYTTVLSVMQSLERKGLVRRMRSSGRAHVYEPAFSQESVVRRVTDEFVTNAFGGRLGEAVLATLSLGSLTPDEKSNIERELQRHKTMAAKKTAKKTAKKGATKGAKKNAKKATKKAALKKTAVKKAAKKTVKKATKKKVAKKAAGKKVAKKAVKKAAKKAVKKAAKKATKKKVVKKAAKKAPKKQVAKKAAKKAVKKKSAKKAAKKKAGK